jgi:ERCC4-type nuclease
MKIIIDNREHTLIKLLNALSNDYEFTDTIEISKLDIGDVAIHSDEGEELLILERKNIADLASSIRDGRYAEQSYRLNGNSLHNHNIIYLIEGRISQYNSKYTKVQPGTLYTTMFSINYFKGFSVFRTFDVSESAEFILRLTDKLRREQMKYGYYHDKHISKPVNYVDVIKKTKKDNITLHNIGPIILSQIPNVSIKTAAVIMKKYNSMLQLLKALDSDKTCLSNLSYKTKAGSSRRISKTAVANIIKYLLPEDNSATIKIDT